MHMIFTIELINFLRHLQVKMKKKHIIKKKKKKSLSLTKPFGNNSQSQRGYGHFICSCQFYFLAFFFDSFTNPESSNASKENCLIGLRCDMAGEPTIDLYPPIVGTIKTSKSKLP